MSRGTTDRIRCVQESMKPLFAVLLLVLAGCSPKAPTFVVEGFAHAGPTCPVMTDPPDPDCADRPVAGAEIAVWGPADNEVARTKTDRNGRFTLKLPEGSYILVPQQVEGLLGTAFMQGIVVPGTTLLDVAYDTGIR